MILDLTVWFDTSNNGIERLFEQFDDNKNKEHTILTAALLALCVTPLRSLCLFLPTNLHCSSICASNSWKQPHRTSIRGSG